MVPVSSESVLEGSRRLRKFLEGLEGSGILWKVPEGSHLGCTTPHGPCLGGKAAQGPSPLLVGEGFN